eukprot:750895-Amphidinium_carterae.1
METQFATRRQFQSEVMNANIKDLPYPDADLCMHGQAQVVLFLQARKVIPTRKYSQECGKALRLRVHQGSGHIASWYWRGLRRVHGCESCLHKESSMIEGTILEVFRPMYWSAWLDTAFMWAIDMPTTDIDGEYPNTHYTTIDSWIGRLQDLSTEVAEKHLNFTSLHPHIKRTMI